MPGREKEKGFVCRRELLLDGADDRRGFRLVCLQRPKAIYDFLERAPRGGGRDGGA